MLSGFSTARTKLQRMYEGAKREVAPQQLSPLSPKVLVGTHHKTGTVWLKRIFRRASETFGLTFLDCDPGDLPKDYDVYFRDHSDFSLDDLDPDYRGLHMIRDPRDRIVSGCFYHQKSSEPWLHKKREEFGGLTYQEKINTYTSSDDRLIFEMEHAGFDSISEMLAWNYENPKFFEVKYEDLIKDSDLVLFHQMYTFLEFPGLAIPQLLQISYDNSLFSGNVKKTLHVRSGGTSQWTKHFKKVHKERFLQLFPDGLIELGYTSDNEWAND